MLKPDRRRAPAVLDTGEPKALPSGLSATTERSHPNLKRAAIVGSFPPRKCGIATFTRDMLDGLIAASPKTAWDVVAINDQADTYKYPARVTSTIAQNDPAAYVAAANMINLAGAEAAFIQHEYGIFGGPAGEHILILMRRLRMPIIVTLHTVLDAPDPDQRRVMDEIIRLAATVVVMAEKGADILARIHRIARSEVHVLPHGAPDRPFAPTDSFKAHIGLADRKTVMTFGLLSPSKGIETIIEALPRVIEHHPDVTYMIVGALHPHLLAREGEVYLDSLVALARARNVEQNVLFINRYVDDAELVELLRAADIYATPYTSENQITSGTLAYAIALGKPVVSTPYWHAAEALADDVGVLCPFGDSEAFAREISALLENDMKREETARRAWLSGTSSRWPAVGAAYLDLAHAARLAVRTGPNLSVRLLAAPRLAAVSRLFDEVGIIQHGKYRVPDRAHGYCVDDAARALSLFAFRARESSPSAVEVNLTSVCAAFLNHSWNPDTGRFRNFMSWDRRWLDDGGCDDCNGRAFEALCLTAAHGASQDLRDWATDLGRRVFQHAHHWHSIRARAHVAKAAICSESIVLETKEVEALLSVTGGLMAAALDAHRPWFEPTLAYDNARLPEALILVGARLGQKALIESGIQSLQWLMQRQTTANGWFRPVPTSCFAISDANHIAFDQQPIEIPGAIDASLAALDATGDDWWRRRAISAFLWFAGENDLGLSIATPEDGGCFDGLTASGCNQNQGAEAVLAYHLASASIRALAETHSQTTLSPPFQSKDGLANAC